MLCLKKATFLIRLVCFSAFLSENRPLFLFATIFSILTHPAAARSIVSYSEPSGNGATMTPLFRLASFRTVTDHTVIYFNGQMAKRWGRWIHMVMTLSIRAADLMTRVMNCCFAWNTLSELNCALFSRRKKKNTAESTSLHLLCAATRPCRTAWQASWI